MKELKDVAKVQAEADMRSDPPFNSDDGYETRYMNPSDDEKIVKYQTDNALDSDIVSTQKHYKDGEKKENHNFDPVKFLVQQKEDNVDEYHSLAEFAPQLSRPNAIVQEKSYAKNSVKSHNKMKAEAKTQAQTKSEKMGSFVAMRKKMMSNWGTK